MNREIPNIFEYNSYRAFLSDLYKERKKRSKNFSHRVFVRICGFKSPNFLKLVIDGKRNLGRSAVEKISNALKFNMMEKKYFNALVNFEQANSPEEKNRHLSNISRLRHHVDVKTIEVKQYKYLSNWHYVAIRELSALNDFSENPKWINRKLGSKLTGKRIAKIINELINLGMLKRDSNGGLKQTDENIICAPEFFSLAINNYHQQMLQKATKSISASKSKDRDISALTISIDRGTFKKIRNVIAECRQEIHRLASLSKSRQVVYQTNIQLFNLSEASWEEQED